MAGLVTIARPYARAAFEFARERGSLKSWQAVLAQAAAVAEHERVESMLSSPSLTANAKADTFCDLLGDLADDKVRNFIHALAGNGRMSLLPQIRELFELYKANHEKTIDVVVHTAFEMSSELELKFVTTLKSRLDRDVTLRTKVDKSLIAGAVIHAGDTVIDGSARGRLEKLGAALKI